MQLVNIKETRRNHPTLLQTPARKGDAGDVVKALMGVPAIKRGSS